MIYIKSNEHNLKQNL